MTAAVSARPRDFSGLAADARDEAQRAPGAQGAITLALVSISYELERMNQRAERFAALVPLGQLERFIRKAVAK